MKNTGFRARQNIDLNLFYIIKVAFQDHIAKQSDWSKNIFFILPQIIRVFKETTSYMVNVEIS